MAKNVMRNPSCKCSDESPGLSLLPEREAAEGTHDYQLGQGMRFEDLRSRLPVSTHGTLEA